MIASLNSDTWIRRRSRSGVTLIEVLIAIVVIGVVVGSTITALRSGFSMIQLARDNTMASQIMQSEMENLRLMNWIQLGQLPEEGEFEVDTLLDANIAARYERVRRVTEVREGMREVELVVQWQTVSGSRHTRTYRTLFSQEGLNDYYYRAFN
jgi:prepilin-type N-terminal cleavage/methylation domain-containing protein